MDAKWEKTVLDFKHQFNMQLVQHNQYSIMFVITNKESFDFLKSYFKSFTGKYMRVLCSYGKKPFSDFEYGLVSCSSYDLDSYNDIKSVIMEGGF